MKPEKNSSQLTVKRHKKKIILRPTRFPWDRSSSFSPHINEAQFIELKESEARFRFLVENTQDLIFYYRIDPSPSFEYVSPSVAPLTGYTQEELLANPQWIHTIIHPQDHHLLDDILRSTVLPLNPLVLRWIRKDGRSIWVEQQITPLRDDNGGWIAIKCQVRYITESERRTHEYETMAAFGASMRPAATRRELIEIILNRSMQLVNAQGAALLVLDPFTGETIIEQGCGSIASASGLHLPREVKMAVVASQTRSFQAGDDELAGNIFTRLAPPQEIQFVTCTPLIAQNEPIGIILLEHELEIAESQIQLLKSILGIASNALQRTTLSERSNQYTRQMATAGKLGNMLSKTLDLPTIYAYAGKFMRAMLPDVAGFFVALFDSDKEILTCVYAFGDGKEIDSSALPPIPLGLPGKGNQSQAVHTRLPVIIADMNEGRKQAVVDVVIGENNEITRSGLFVPMLSQDKVIGVVNVQSYIVNRFTKQDADIMTLVSNTTAVAIENARLVQGLQETNLNLVAAYDATIAGWTLALDIRDHETEGHSLRVSALTVQLARSMGFADSQIVHIQRGALLHDIGKIGIPDAILNKPGPLTPDEWEIMRKHPQIACDLLTPIDYLNPAIDIPFCHHEKWDGTGYPRKLQGEQIPLAARLFAIIDVWDALRSDRPYRPKWSFEKTCDYIRQQTGVHFDPRVVDPFLEMIMKKESRA